VNSLFVASCKSDSDLTTQFGDRLLFKSARGVNVVHHNKGQNLWGCRQLYFGDTPDLFRSNSIFMEILEWLEIFHKLQKNISALRGVVCHKETWKMMVLLIL